MVLELGLREAGRDQADTKAEKIAELQERQATKSLGLSQRAAEHNELTSELRRVKLQHTAGATVSDDLKSVAGASARPAKRFRMTLMCKKGSTAPPTTAFSALLIVRDDFKNCFEALTLENQCFAELAAEAKGLRKMLANRNKTDATAKTTMDGYGRKCTTAVNKQLIALEAEHADAKAAHTPLVDVSAWSEADVTKARADLEGGKVRFGEVKQASNLAKANLDDTRK